jgi:hypothetical protein
MMEYVNILKKIMELNKKVMLASDVMFVNGLGFIISILRKIKVITAAYIPSRKQPILVKSLNKIFNIYKSRGFVVNNAVMDREFECLREDILEVHLNTTAASEHIPEIEMQICLINERVRAIISIPPFKHIPGWMIIELVNYVEMWLNAFSPESGVSKTLFPITIMTGTTIDFENIVNCLLASMLNRTRTC